MGKMLMEEIEQLGNMCGSTEISHYIK